MHSMIQLLTNKAFTKNCHGGISILTAFLLGTLFLLIGGVLDFGRAYIIQASAQGALDASSLAASRYDLTDTGNYAAANASARKYFNVNFPSGRYGTNINAENIAVQVQPVSDGSNKVVTQLGGGSKMNGRFLSQGGDTSLTLAKNSEVTQNKVYEERYFDINLSANDVPSSVCSDTQSFNVPVLDNKYTVRMQPFSNFPSDYSDTGTPGRLAYTMIDGYCRAVGVGQAGEPAPRTSELDPAVSGYPREGLRIDFGGLKVVSLRVGISALYTEDCFNNSGGCRLENNTVPTTYKDVQEQYCPLASLNQPEKAPSLLADGSPSLGFQKGAHILLGGDGGGGDGGGGDGGGGDGAGGEGAGGDGGEGGEGGEGGDGEAGDSSEGPDGWTYTYPDGTGDEPVPDENGNTYDHNNTLCTPDQMQTRTVQVIDTDAYTTQNLVTNEWYLGTPDNITAHPRKGIEHMTWAAYRNGARVATGTIEGTIWLEAGGGYGRGETTINIADGFDSLMLYSNEVGSDGSLEFIRGIIMMPKFKDRITK